MSPFSFLTLKRPIWLSPENSFHKVLPLMQGSATTWHFIGTAGSYLKRHWRTSLTWLLAMEEIPTQTPKHSRCTPCPGESSLNTFPLSKGLPLLSEEMSYLILPAVGITQVNLCQELWNLEVPGPFLSGQPVCKLTTWDGQGVSVRHQRRCHQRARCSSLETTHSAQPQGPRQSRRALPAQPRPQNLQLFTYSLRRP